MPVGFTTLDLQIVHMLPHAPNPGRAGLAYLSSDRCARHRAQPALLQAPPSKPA